MSQIVMPTYNPSRTACMFHNSDHFSCVVWRGVGTGKSVMMIQEPLRRGFAQDPGVDGVRRTRLGWCVFYPSSDNNREKRLASG